MWLSEDTLAVEYADETLAIYKVKHQPDHQHLIDVAEPQIFQTQHRSQQLHLWATMNGSRCSGSPTTGLAGNLWPMECRRLYSITNGVAQLKMAG